MRAEYCKPVTEVDDLVLENDFLTGTQPSPTTPTINDDLDGPEDIDW